MRGKRQVKHITREGHEVQQKTSGAEMDHVEKRRQNMSKTLIYSSQMREERKGRIIGNEWMVKPNKREWQWHKKKLLSQQVEYKKR